MPKPDRRVRRTRRRLRDALIELIPLKGYDQITVQDITDHADLSRATFYLHFADKDDLLASSLEEMFDELVQSLPGPLFRLPDVPTNGNRSAKAQHSTSIMVFDHVYTNQVLYKALLIDNRGVHYVLYREIQYLALLAEAQLARVTPAERAEGTLSYALIAHHIAGSLFSLILWWLENDLRQSPADMAQAWEQLTLPSIISGLSFSLDDTHN